MKISLENGKYTWIFDEQTGSLKCLRYDAAWRDETGDKAIYALMVKVEELTRKLDSCDKDRIKKLTDYLESIRDKFGEVLYEEIPDLIDQERNPIYCEKCGSCGEDGCCCPTRCKTVQGLYCNENVKSWKTMMDELDKYLILKNKLNEYLKYLSLDGKTIRQQLRRELQEMVNE